MVKRSCHCLRRRGCRSRGLIRRRRSGRKRGAAAAARQERRRRLVGRELHVGHAGGHHARDELVRVDREGPRVHRLYERRSRVLHAHSHSSWLCLTAFLDVGLLLRHSRQHSARHLITFARSHDVRMICNALCSPFQKEGDKLCF